MGAQMVWDGTTWQMAGAGWGHGPGDIRRTARTDVPDGYLRCNGASVSTTTYSTLFAKVGYDYGGSGGSFNVPLIEPLPVDKSHNNTLDLSPSSSNWTSGDCVAYRRHGMVHLWLQAYASSSPAGPYSNPDHSDHYFANVPDGWAPRDWISGINAAGGAPRAYSIATGRAVRVTTGWGASTWTSASFVTAEQATATFAYQPAAADGPFIYSLIKT